MSQIKIADVKIDKDLFDGYVKWRKNADKYLSTNKNIDGRDIPMSDYEKSQRWLMCSKKVMEIHRKICEEAGIEYTEDTTDEFYMEFHKRVREALR
jgi:hypothetical protein